MPKTIICYGEALWDCLPNGLFFGGAPMNAAFHLRRFGADAWPLTCVGRDFLGDEATERMAAAGLPPDLIHRHDSLPTGTVKVKIDARGNASYSILEPVAWDRIPVDEQAAALADKADAVIYGTLAQRGEFNRGEITKLLARDSLFKIYDVNLRPPYDDLDLVQELARPADLLKLNEEELFCLLPVESRNVPLKNAARLLRDRIGVRRICVTRAEKGAAFLDEGEWLVAEGRKVTVRDTVGAGDGFLAAFTANYLAKSGSSREILEIACRFGEFIATRDGAVPPYNPKEWILDRTQ